MATIDEQISLQNSRVDTFTNDFASFIDSLLASVNVNFTADQVVAFHQPVDAAANALNSIIGQFPEVPDPSVPVFAMPPVPDISLQPIVASLDTIDAARQKVLSDLEDGGYGIDTGDEAQLLDRARDRATLEADAAVKEIERAFINRRFSIPPGTMFDPLEMAKDQVRRTVSEANRDIYVQRANQFVQARQFAISAGGTLDQARVSIQEAEFRTYAEAARLQLSVFQAALDHVRTEIQAALDRATLIVRVVEARASVADSRVRAAVAQSQLFIDNYNANVRAFLGVLDNNLNNARNQLDAQIKSADLRISAAQSGSAVYANIVSSGMGAFTTLINKSEEV